MLVTLWSTRIRDADATPRKRVTAFNVLQIELIDSPSQSYDGAILNLGMKPEFLPINSLFSSLDHAVSKSFYSPMIISLNEGTPAKLNALIT